MNTCCSTYAFQDIADDSIRDVLVTVPGRWGRMPPLTRAVIVETGKVLQKHGIGGSLQARTEDSPSLGMIGGTRWGSHVTDLAFAESMRADIKLASPAIFGYTAANIPLAEAAAHFGLTGPVYALMEADNPLQAAVDEAQLLLRWQPGLDMMLACEFDARYLDKSELLLSVTCTLQRRNDD